MLLRYPFSLFAVALAFAVSGGMYVVLSQKAGHGSKTLDLSGYPAAVRGWSWKDGTPGFVVRTGREEWNVSRVRPAELPPGARLLNAQRNGDALLLLVARGHCIGAGTSDGLTWFCRPRLAHTVAFVLVDPVASARSFPLNMLVATRGDVRRVVVRNPAVFRTVHRDNSVTTRYGEGRTLFPIHGNWGTFADSTVDDYLAGAPAHPWRVRLDFYGARGRLASEQIALARAGTQLIVVR